MNTWRRSRLRAFFSQSPAAPTGTAHSSSALWTWRLGDDAGKVAPEDANIGIVSVTNIGRDVYIEAREIRVRIEEIIEILPADHASRRINVTRRG